MSRARRRACWWSRWARTVTTRGAKVISNAFNDFGFEVSMGELFQTPSEAAALAKEEDVHVVGV